jgi:DNA-binding response OmpR family regulator
MHSSNLTDQDIGAAGRSLLTRVLVVDDDEDLRLVTTTYLRAHGYDVQEARDAASARRMLAEPGTDIVVLDLGLPDDDGLNLVREIRASSS